MKKVFAQALKSAPLAIAVIAFLVGLTYVLLPSDAKLRAEAAKELRSRKIREAKSGPGQKTRTEVRIGDRASVRRPKADVAAVKSEKSGKALDASAFELIDFDTAELSEEVKRIYAQIQASFSEDPFMETRQGKRKLIASVQALLAMIRSGTSVPAFVKNNVIDALAWAGGEGLSEMVGFMADADPEVATYSKEKFQEALDDFSLGDREKSAILKEVVKVVHDRDDLDTYFTELANMRNSVRVDTALAIVDSGNEDAIAVLEQDLDMHFGDGEGDYEVKTREDIVRYGKDNPDSEDDEAMYGGGDGQMF